MGGSATYTMALLVITLLHHTPCVSHAIGLVLETFLVEIIFLFLATLATSWIWMCRWSSSHPLAGRRSRLRHVACEVGGATCGSSYGKRASRARIVALLLFVFVVGFANPSGAAAHGRAALYVAGHPVRTVRFAVATVASRPAATDFPYTRWYVHRGCHATHFARSGTPLHPGPTPDSPRVQHAHATCWDTHLVTTSLPRVPHVSDSMRNFRRSLQMLDLDVFDTLAAIHRVVDLRYTVSLPRLDDTDITIVHACANVRGHLEDIGYCHTASGFVSDQRCTLFDYIFPPSGYDRDIWCVGYWDDETADFYRRHQHRRMSWHTASALLGFEYTLTDYVFAWFVWQRDRLGYDDLEEIIPLHADRLATRHYPIYIEHALDISVTTARQWRNKRNTARGLEERGHAIFQFRTFDRISMALNQAESDFILWDAYLFDPTNRVSRPRWLVLMLLMHDIELNPGPISAVALRTLMQHNRTPPNLYRRYGDEHQWQLKRPHTDALQCYALTLEEDITARGEGHIFLQLRFKNPAGVEGVIVTPSLFWKAQQITVVVGLARSWWQHAYQGLRHPHVLGSWGPESTVDGIDALEDYLGLPQESSSSAGLRITCSVGQGRLDRYTSWSFVSSPQDGIHETLARIAFQGMVRIYVRGHPFGITDAWYGDGPAIAVRVLRSTHSSIQLAVCKSVDAANGSLPAHPSIYAVSATGTPLHLMPVHTAPATIDATPPTPPPPDATAPAVPPHDVPVAEPTPNAPVDASPVPTGGAAALADMPFADEATLPSDEFRGPVRYGPAYRLTAAAYTMPDLSPGSEPLGPGGVPLTTREAVLALRRKNARWQARFDRAPNAWAARNELRIETADFIGFAPTYTAHAVFHTAYVTCVSALHDCPRWWMIDSAHHCLHTATTAQRALRIMRGQTCEPPIDEYTTNAALAAAHFDAYLDDGCAYSRVTLVDGLPPAYFDLSHSAGHASFIFLATEREARATLATLTRHNPQLTAITGRPTTSEFHPMWRYRIPFQFLFFLVTLALFSFVILYGVTPYNPDCYGRIYQNHEFVVERTPPARLAAMAVRDVDYDQAYADFRANLFGVANAPEPPPIIRPPYYPEAVPFEDLFAFLGLTSHNQLHASQPLSAPVALTVGLLRWAARPFRSVATPLTVAGSYFHALLPTTILSAAASFIDFVGRDALQGFFIFEDLENRAFACASDRDCRLQAELSKMWTWQPLCPGARTVDYFVFKWSGPILLYCAVVLAIVGLVRWWFDPIYVRVPVHHHVGCDAIAANPATRQSSQWGTHVTWSTRPCNCRDTPHDPCRLATLADRLGTALPFIAAKAVVDPTVVPFDAWLPRVMSGLVTWADRAPDRYITDELTRDAVRYLVSACRHNTAAVTLSGAAEYAPQTVIWTHAPLSFAVHGKCEHCGTQHPGRHSCSQTLHSCGNPMLAVNVQGVRSIKCTFCHSTPFVQRIYRYFVATQETAAIWYSETFHHAPAFFMPARLATKVARNAFDASIHEVARAIEAAPRYMPQLCGVGFTARIPFVTHVCRETAFSCLRGRAMVPQRRQTLWQIVADTLRDRITPQLQRANPTPLQPTPFEEWNARFPRGRRNEQARTHATLKHTPLVKRDLLRKVFIKREKLIKDLSRATYAGRAISSTSSATQVTWGPYAHAFGGLLKRVFNGRGTHFYATGMDCVAIGAVLQSWVDEGYVYASDSDFSKYDATIHHEALCAEHDVYRAVFGPLPPDVEAVLAAQLHSHGVFMLARTIIAKFSFLARRNSGDANTSCGNTLLNLAMAMTCVSILGIDARIAVVGDDALFLTREHLGGYATRITNLYSCFGFELDFHARDTLIHARFLGSTLFFANVDGHRQLILAPELPRFVAKAGWALDKQSKPLAWARGVAIGYSPISAAIPVMHNIVAAMMRNTTSETRIRFEHSDTAARCHQVQQRVTMEPDAYAQIASTYGLDPRELREFCCLIDGINVLPALVDTGLCSALFVAE